MPPMMILKMETPLREVGLSQRGIRAVMGYYNTLSSLFSKTRALSCVDVPVRTILVVTVAKLTLGYDCLITCIYGCGSGMSAFKLAVRARGRRIRDNVGSWHTTGRSSLWIVTCRTVLIFVVSFKFDVLFLE